LVRWASGVWGSLDSLTAFGVARATGELTFTSMKAISYPGGKRAATFTEVRPEAPDDGDLDARGAPSIGPLCDHRRSFS
jgi:hypothetical protein